MSQKFTSIMRFDAEKVVSDLGETLEPLCGSHLLITGAAGFLCSAFLDALHIFNTVHQKQPVRVTALDNLKVGFRERLAHLENDPNIRFLEHDITEPFAGDDPVDYLIHGASIASPSFYRKFPLETIDVNVNGTWRMLELALKNQTKSTLVLSSSEVYGDPDPAHIPTSESYIGQVSFTGPRACYDEGKRLGETLCVNYHRIHGLKVKVARPFNVYGPGQSLDDLRIIPDLMKNALQKERLVLLSDGSPTRSFCYLSDCVFACFKLLLSDANGEAFNIGNDEEISIGDAARIMAQVAGNPPLEVKMEKSPENSYLTDSPQRRCPDLSKIYSSTGYRPKVGLEEGLARTFASYQEALGTEPLQQ